MAIYLLTLAVALTIGVVFTVSTICLTLTVAAKLTSIPRAGGTAHSLQTRF